MPQLESIFSASGGLNQDDSLIAPPNRQSLFEAGDYLYARNVRIGSSIENNTGAVENFPSTLEVTDFQTWDGSAWIQSTAPSGKCIGKKEDKTNGCFYYIVRVDATRGLILKFVKSTKSIYCLLDWNFAFPDAWVSMTLIGQYVVFTDKVNGPRIIDTTSVYKLKSTLGNNFSEFHISFSKWAPSAPADVYADTAHTNEYLKTDQFQFTYRYAFKGGFVTTFAPHTPFCSNAPYGNQYYFTLFINGCIFDSNDPASTSFSHASNRFYEMVEYIELAFRTSTKDTFKVFQRYKVDNGNNYLFTFSNQSTFIRIPVQMSNQYFNAVPITSGCVESVDNRIMFGNNLDELEPQSDFDVTNVEVYSNAVDITGPFSGYSSLNSAQQQYLENKLAIQPFNFKQGGVYKGAILYQAADGRTGLAQTSDSFKWEIPKSQAGALNTLYSLGFKIASGIKPPAWAVAYQILISECLNIEFFLHGEINEWRFLRNDPNGLNDHIQTPDPIQTIMNDYFNATAGLPDSLSDIESILNSQNKDYPLSKRVNQSIRKSREVTVSGTASHLYLDISNWSLGTKKDVGDTRDNDGMNNLFYNFLQGDRVKFFAIELATSTLIQLDAEIISFTGNGIIIAKPSELAYGATYSLPRRQDSTSFSSAIDTTFRVEIYRPKKLSPDQEVLFYEKGEWYPVSKPTTEDRDYTKKDWTWTNSASVTAGSLAGKTWFNNLPLLCGDVWVVSKNFYYDYSKAWFDGTSTQTYWMQMTSDPKKANGFWEKNLGRAFVAYKTFPTQFEKPNQVRFGGKFYQDGLYNGINNFLEENQKIYPAEYGKIRILVNTNNVTVQSVGNILLAIGEEQAWSIYINRTTLEDLSGSTQVILSDKILGSYNTLLGDYGTLNPESISKKNGRVIWWNSKFGVWCRYSTDGITPLSEEKMKNWFKDLSVLLVDQYDTNPPKALSIFDSYHNEWITRLDHDSLPSTFKGYESYKCVSFSERPSDKRWKEFWDYAPDMFAALDTDVYSIIGCVIHIHESGTDFGKIYGQSVPSQMEIAFTDNSRFKKDAQTVRLMATDPWSFDKIRGDWQSNSGAIKETSIPLTALVLKEGIYHSEIQRDKNSPNFVDENAAIVNGNPMKVNTLRVFITLDPAVDYLSVLHWLSVGFNGSSVNPKN